VRILVEISTKNRDSILGRLLASLLLQTYQDFDILIINDGTEKVGATKTTEALLGLHSLVRGVFVVEGSHISQAHNHNIPLYDPRFRGYKYIFRADDDIILSRRVLESMVNTAIDKKVDAVGGLWFESEYIDDVFHDMSHVGVVPLDKKDEISGRVGFRNSNWQQRMYHDLDDFQEVEHIYSNCLYNADAMREVGGWPEVYSPGVAHGEETDGTYRLFLAGKRLVICPTAFGQHLKASGGIRATADVGRAQYMDNLKWRSRLPLIRAINFKPTVAVWCQHSHGVGGAQKSFYQLVHLLQENGIDAYPVFTDAYYSPDECESLFGFRYEEGDELDEYDVCIVMGHELFKPVKARRYLAYIFFPDGKLKDVKDYGAIMTNSKFTAEWVCKRWNIDRSCVFPVYHSVPKYGPGKKENIILFVGRLDPFKAPLAAIDEFVRMELDGWKLVVVGGKTGRFAEYEELIASSIKGLDNIVLLEDIPQGDLESLYRGAKMVWCFKGIYGKDYPNECEHFGLVPLEAMGAGCVPIAFDAGGHRETVPDRFRWKTVDELKQITLDVASWGDDAFGVSLCADDSFYSDERYVAQVIDMIHRVNGLALEVKVNKVITTKRKIRVAAVADSPRLTTGFGVVVNEIYKRLIENDDIDLYVFGIMDTDVPKKDELPFNFYPMHPDDLQGYKMLPEFVRWAQPHVYFELYDPGSAMAHLMSLDALGQGSLPKIVYFPVEGDGINKPTVQLVEKVNVAVTYCKSGVDAINRVFGQDTGVFWQYHGMDHAPFAPLSEEKRSRYRKLVGFDGKFVICNVGTNKRVKQQPYLIEAVKILLERGEDDVYLYLHTKKYNRHVMQGWDLPWIIEREERLTGLPLSKHILFPVEFENMWKGVPYNGWDELDEYLLSMPPSAQMRGAIFNNLDMITRYGLMDAYVDVSSAEGFGLPPLEVAACGVPTISVEDGMVRSEVHSKYCYMVRPKHWTTWHSGAKLLLADPVDVANAILDIKYTSGLADRLKDRSSHILQDLRWEPVARFFEEKIIELGKVF